MDGTRFHPDFSPFLKKKKITPWHCSLHWTSKFGCGPHHHSSYWSAICFSAVALGVGPPAFYICSGLAMVYHRSFVSSIQTRVEDGVDIGCRVSCLKCLWPHVSCLVFLFFLVPLFVFFPVCSSGNGPEQPCPPRWKQPPGCSSEPGQLHGNQYPRPHLELARRFQ